MKNKIKIVIFIVVVLFCIVLINNIVTNEDNKIENKDKIKFSKLYDVDEDNVFEKMSAEGAANLVENGTGILYLGYTNCPWCQDLVPLLNKIAKNNNINSVYYIEDFYDMRPDKSANPKYNAEYNKIVSKIEEYENKTGESIKEDNIIRVPLVLFVKNGEIVGYQLGTVEEHEITKDENNNYTLRDLTEDEINTINKKLENLIHKIYSNACSSGC